MEAVIAAVITGVLALVGVVITNYCSNQKMRTEVQTEIQTSLAVQNTKIEELTREVRLHNNFARRMPVVENEIRHLGKEVKHIEEDINKYHG